MPLPPRPGSPKKTPDKSTQVVQLRDFINSGPRPPKSNAKVPTSVVGEEEEEQPVFHTKSPVVDTPDTDNYPYDDYDTNALNEDTWTTEHEAEEPSFDENEENGYSDNPPYQEYAPTSTRQNSRTTPSSSQANPAQGNYGPRGQEQVKISLTKNWNIRAILGLIFAFVFPPAGLVFSVLGFLKAKKTQRGLGTSVAAFSISIVSMIIMVAFIIPMGMSVYASTDHAVDGLMGIFSTSEEMSLPVDTPEVIPEVAPDVAPVS